MFSQWTEWMLSVHTLNASSSTWMLLIHKTFSIHPQKQLQSTEQSHFNWLSFHLSSLFCLLRPNWSVLYHYFQVFQVSSFFTHKTNKLPKGAQCFASCCCVLISKIEFSLFSHLLSTLLPRHATRNSNGENSENWMTMKNLFKTFPSDDDDEFHHARLLLVLFYSRAIKRHLRCLSVRRSNPQFIFGERDRVDQHVLESMSELLAYVEFN